MTPEKYFSQQPIIDYLNELIKKGFSVWFERRDSGGFGYKKGIPDLYCVINGYHVEIECKAPRGNLSTMQEKFRLKMQHNHIYYCCCRSLDDFKQFILVNFNVYSD